MYIDKELRDFHREIEIKKIKRRKQEQKECTHTLGGELGYYNPNDLDAFCVLKLPTGEDIAVCLYCQKLISSIDPSDNELWKRIPSRNISSKAESGQYLDRLQYEDQLWAQLVRQTPEEKDRILKEKIGLLHPRKPEPKPEPKKDRQYTAAEMYDMPEDQLKELAQQYLDKVLPKKR